MAIIFASIARNPEVFRAVKAGRMRKLASKLYTDDLTSPADEIVRRHRLEIAAHFYPGALISHRSALEGNISPGGKLHLTLPNAVAPVRKLPGLEIRIWRGPAPQVGDARTPLVDGKELITQAKTCPNDGQPFSHRSRRFQKHPQPIRFPHVRRSRLGSRNSGAWLASQLRPVFTHRSRPLRPCSDRGSASLQ